MRIARKRGRVSAAPSVPASAQTSQAGKWAPAIGSTGSQPESPTADTTANTPVVHRFAIRLTVRPFMEFLFVGSGSSLFSRGMLLGCLSDDCVRDTEPAEVGIHIESPVTDE